MRILTIGAKSTINEALAQQPGVEVWNMSIGSDLPKGVTGSMPYTRRGKINLRSIQEVRHAIRESRPDVVHAFYPRPLAHAVFAAKSLGSSVPIISFRGIASKPMRWSPEQWITYLSPRVTAHACESLAVSDSLVAAGVPRERCHVVYNAMGTAPTRLTRQEARRELSLREDAFVVMMVANMRWVKGADLLLNAALRCLDLPRLQVALVGRVHDSQVQRLAADPRLKGRVHLRGFEPRASRLLGAADMFVMPSRSEALCVALIEAMSARLCPVVSDAGGLKEAVRHGIDGIVFPRQDVNALASAVRELYHDPKQLEEYGTLAQARALSEFSSEAFARRLIDLYGQVLKQPQPVAV